MKKKNRLAAGKEQFADKETINSTPDDEEQLPFEASTTQEGSVIEVLTKSQDYDEDNWEENAKPPAKEDVLLVYPFQGGYAIEKAAQGLFLYEEKHCNASFLLQLQKEKCHPRNVSLIISKKDRERLEPGKWLNDNLIDFWMQWIMRMELQPDSSIYVFTTYFYTKLSTEGVESIIDWTTNRDIDIFSKKNGVCSHSQRSTLVFSSCY
jgi:hypothetical protein